MAKPITAVVKLQVPAGQATPAPPVGTALGPHGVNIMECTTCKSRNYFTTKNRRKHPERAEWKKYCPRCNKHQSHKESK